MFEEPILDTMKTKCNKLQEVTELLPGAHHTSYNIKKELKHNSLGSIYHLGHSSVSWPGLYTQLGPNKSLDITDILPNTFSLVFVM